MSKSQPRWSFEDACRMEDFIKAGKPWHVLPKYFPGRTEQSVQAKYFSVKANGAYKPRNCPQRINTAGQDNAFQAAMIRAGAELRRQESIAQPPERKRA